MDRAELPSAAAGPGDALLTQLAHDRTHAGTHATARATAPRDPGRQAVWALPFGSVDQVVEYDALDALGSVRAVIDEQGQVLRRHEFRPFGEEWQPLIPPEDARLFTGKERDVQTGFDYFGARYYRPDLGRFTTVDPVGPAAGDNLYAYVVNNPLTFVDPTGLQQERPQRAEPLPIFQVEVICDKKCQDALLKQIELHNDFVFTKTRPPADRTPLAVIRRATQALLGMRAFQGSQGAAYVHWEACGSLCRNPVTGIDYLAPWALKQVGDSCPSITGCSPGMTTVADLHTHSISIGQQQPSPQDIAYARAHPEISIFLVLTPYSNTPNGVVYQFNATGAWSVWGPAIPFINYR